MIYDICTNSIIFIVDAFSMFTSENRLNIGILKYHSINK